MLQNAPFTVIYAFYYVANMKIYIYVIMAYKIFKFVFSLSNEHDADINQTRIMYLTYFL